MIDTPFQTLRIFEKVGFFAGRLILVILVGSLIKWISKLVRLSKN